MANATIVKPLEVRYKGKSISDVLNMTINQGVEFFEHLPSIAHKLKTIQEVGLGYITLDSPRQRFQGVNRNGLS